MWQIILIIYLLKKKNNIISNLPAKSQQEANKHKQEYEKMVNIAKKKGSLRISYYVLLLSDMRTISRKSDYYYERLVC